VCAGVAAVWAGLWSASVWRGQFESRAQKTGSKDSPPTCNWAVCPAGQPQLGPGDNRQSAARRCSPIELDQTADQTDVLTNEAETPGGQWAALSAQWAAHTLASDVPPLASPIESRANVIKLLLSSWLLVLGGEHKPIGHSKWAECCCWAEV